jgi:3-isopropylmalate dehydrogenase
MKYTIAVIPGDGIGPEVTEATLEVIEAVRETVGLELDIRKVRAGDNALRELGTPLPDETVNTVRSAHCTLKGPVGESAKDVIVRLRQLLDLYINLRPAKCYPNVACFHPDVDLVIVRENTEGLYRGLEFEMDSLAVALRVISEAGSRRIAEYAFKLAEARNRKKEVTVVHKANVLTKTCGLFARVCREVAAKHPQVRLREMYVDAAAMNLIRQPQDFDVIVTTNLFGDILSDEAAQIVGGLGLAPAANLGDVDAIFEPVHGSAPDIAGKGLANPLSMILSAKMMFEWLGARFRDQRCSNAAILIEAAVRSTLERGIMTLDLGGSNNTMEVANAVKGFIPILAATLLKEQ